MVKLSDSDLKKLKSAHPDLVRIIMEYCRISIIPIKIHEVKRDMTTQLANIKKGVSWTTRSRHLPSKDGLCRAVDAVPIDEKGNPIWAWPIYYKLAPIMKQAAKNVKIPIEWGGDWKKSKDGPHWQLPWKFYP